MALSIRNQETEKLARQVSRLTGETLTEAIGKSLEERLERLQRSRSRQTIRRQIHKILARVDALPDRDSRSADAILGYDDNGLLS